MTDKKTGISTDLVRELAELLVEKDLNEIDVKDQDVRIRLSRGNQNIAMPSMPMAMPAPGTLIEALQNSALSAPEKTNAQNAVPSPMVGTVYLSGSPESAPYVSVGASVSEGDTILIIEAMKTMNHIAAPRSGTISAILVEDKQPVEFGEALVVID
jgi:acetyl-CoA carboxylase biotin carboxyl carrier protein